MIPRPVQIAFGLFIFAFVTVTPFVYESYSTKNFRNFRVVEDGVLYRSAQLPVDGLRRCVNDYSIKTIVSLRDGAKDDEKVEEIFCQQNGIRFVRIPPMCWERDDETGVAEVETGLAEFRKVMNDPKNHPVLLHCFAGIHRTGSYCAVYRMDRGWTNERACQELRTCGYVTFDNDQDVNEFLTTYCPARTVSRPK